MDCHSGWRSETRRNRGSVARFGGAGTRNLSAHPASDPCCLGGAGGAEHLVANVSVVDDNDAFLAFGDDGAMLPTGLALPRGPVWLLVPGSGDELSYDGEPRVIADLPCPRVGRSGPSHSLTLRMSSR